MNLFVLLKLHVKHNFTMSFKLRIEALVLTLCIFSLKIRFFEIVRKPLNLFSEQYQTLIVLHNNPHRDYILIF